jgi:hypothetical protein
MAEHPKHPEPRPAAPATPPIGDLPPRPAAERAQPAGADAEADAVKGGMGVNRIVVTDGTIKP